MSVTTRSFVSCGTFVSRDEAVAFVRNEYISLALVQGELYQGDQYVGLGYAPDTREGGYHG